MRNAAVLRMHESLLEWELKYENLCDRYEPYLEPYRFYILAHKVENKSGQKFRVLGRRRKDGERMGKGRGEGEGRRKYAPPTHL